MINENCTSIQWISEISSKKKADKGLVQKLIRALMLLEGLSESNLNFVFKGGTALMLLLNSTKRLSIDIDIIVSKEVEDIEELLADIATKKGFSRVDPQQRKANSIIEKAHYKFYFPCSIKAGNEEFVLLDILFEEIRYSKLISTPIESSFVTHKGVILQVSTPDFNNIMGDKLTAFAPNTTGIPYFKEKKSMGQEIVKQLYDVGNIFEHIDNVAEVKSVFTNLAKVELNYRDMSGDVNIVFDDIVENCLSICLREQVGQTNFEVLQLGLKQITDYIFSESYHIEKAITHAARTAYTIALMKTETSIQRYSNRIDMTKWLIELPNNPRLNKLKKTNPEAFYYWYMFYNL
ncbi:MAG: nucleotidyl transferase AbiEii/AbiGii toxin family protein [Bacteroidota bacterium]|nr:nucleotidyl transferase AbiEii/AbiGii toxin family protein [Bacteroidota bacterium]